MSTVARPDSARLRNWPPRLPASTCASRPLLARAQLAGARERAVDRARPVGQEVAGVEAGQRGVGSPFQRGRPRQVAGGIQPSLRHRRPQRLHVHTVAIAGAGEVDGRAFVGALQPRLSLQCPAFRLAGQPEIRVAADVGLAVGAAPVQAARIHRELQGCIVGVAQVGDAIDGDAAIEQVDHQRLQLQAAIDQAEFRGLHDRGELALRDRAADVGMAAAAVRIDIERQRCAGLAAGEQAEVERVAARTHMPTWRVLVATQAQGRLRGRRQPPGDGHVHAREIALRDQPQPQPRCDPPTAGNTAVPSRSVRKSSRGR